MDDRVQRFRFADGCAGECDCTLEDIADGDYVEYDDYAKLETELRETKRRANLAIGCLEVKEQLNETLRAESTKNKRLRSEIIEQGRKVLNATSDIGMSHTEYIEWVMGELEGK